MRKLFTIVMMMLVTAGLAIAQAGPFSGKATVSLQFSPAAPTMADSNLTVDVYVDLSGITGSGSAAAALGGFAIPVAFDNSRLTLTAVTPGSSTAFNVADFVSTDVDRANARGFVTLVNTQTQSGTPTGSVHVATLTFKINYPGKAIFSVNSARTIHEGSLASTYDSTNGGPAEIEFQDQSYDVEIDTGGAPYHLTYPVFISTSDLSQGVSVVNEGAVNADLTFRYYNSAGQVAQVGNLVNPTTLADPLLPLSQYVRNAPDLFDGQGVQDVSSGWIDVESVEPDISGFFLLYKVENGGVTQMDGADAGHITSARMILPYFGKDASRTTDISIVNPGDQTATGNLYLRMVNGVPYQTISLSIPAHGSFEGSYAPTDIAGDGYMDIQMTTGQVSAFERFGTAQALAALNGQDGVNPSNLLYAAHFASGYAGARWFSQLNIVNPNATSSEVQFRLINDNGQEIASAVRTLDPNSLLMVQGYQLFGFANPQTTNNFVSGSVVIECDQGLVGSVTFGDPVNGQYLASLPLLSTSSAKRELFLDHVAIGSQGTTNYFTGIALVNPSQTRTANITMQLYNQDGQLVSETSTPYTLAPGKHVAQMVSDFLANTDSQFGGFLKITSDVEIYSFMLFGDASLNFLSAVPVR